MSDKHKSAIHTAIGRNVTDAERRGMAAALANPSTRVEAEKWLTTLGTQLVSVWFLDKDGVWVDERHVDDSITIDETIDMTLRRTGWRYSLRLCSNGRWELRGRGKYRYFDSREAAEMVAVHNG